MAAGPSMQATPAARLDLRQNLSAGLQQGMALLGLPALDLHEELQRQAEKNPFLLVERRSSMGSLGALAADQIVAAEPTLADQLQTQISCMTLAPKVRALALFLASDLDERGFLPDADDAIASELGVPEKDIVAARAALQACEPCGIGARDVREAIALQLIDAGYEPDVAHAAMQELRAFAEMRWRDVAQHLDVTIEYVETLARQIRACTPDPASAFAPPEARPLVPELTVERVQGGGLRVRLLDDPSTTIRFDEALSFQLKSSGAPLQGQLAPASQNAARRLVASLHFRSKTLLRVGAAMAEAQSRFFLGQSRVPEPLARAQIAHTLGLHPATVGRAVKGRGVLFDGQVKSMCWFFPSGIASASAVVSQPEIMARLRDLLAEETRDTVLNDEAIAARLRQDGVDIARRTVAKYRKCLRIPSSPERRRLLAP
ncbi:MAG: hypothetical protein AAGB05_15090 [Pseudomonadota bacterium]